MKTRISISIVTLALTLSLNAFGTPLFSDNFNAPNSADINSQRGQRQSGSAAPLAYQAVTMGNATAIANDQIKIENNALSIISAPKKGPASILLNRDLADLGPSYRLGAVIHVDKIWAALLLTPDTKGNWPDSAVGLTMNIWANGTWCVWNNTTAPKQIIARGRVTQADKYQVELDINEANGKTVTVSINGTKVVDGKPFQYTAPTRYLILQTNGQATFDDLSISSAN